MKQFEFNGTTTLGQLEHGDVFMMQQRGKVSQFRVLGYPAGNPDAYIEYVNINTRKCWYTYARDTKVIVLKNKN